MKSRIDLSDAFKDALPFGDVKIFLVDSENVGWSGIKGFEELDGEDVVYYFTTAEREKEKVAITVAQFFKMRDVKEGPILQKVNVTPNGKKDYLDDCIKTALGYLINTTQDVEVIIVSNDEGYQATIEFWEQRGVKVSRASSIENYLHPQVINNKITKSAISNVHEMIEQIQKEKKENDILALMKEYKCGKTKKKQQENAAKALQMSATKTINKFSKSFGLDETKATELAEKLRKILQ